jgi:hypothetical protein
MIIMNGQAQATNAIVGAIPVVIGAGLLSYTIDHIYGIEQNRTNPPKVTYTELRKSADVGEVL